MEGPPRGWEEGEHQTFDGSLTEDANSDRVRGVKSCKIPKISKIRKRGEAKHESSEAGMPFNIALASSIFLSGTAVQALRRLF
jgi:hypothetical protein